MSALTKKKNNGTTVESNKDQNNYSLNFKDKKGMFIVIEGCDSSGKTTIAKDLTSVFIELFKHVLVTTEPTLLTEFGVALRTEGTIARLGKNKELEYFEKDRSNHLNKFIIPLVENGIHVISDRYYHSTIAYQSHDLKDAEELFLKLTEEYLHPDATFILDLSTHIITSRLDNNRKSRTAYENEIDYLCKIYSNIKGKNIYHIDANRSSKEILTEIINIIFRDVIFYNYCFKKKYLTKCEPAYCSFRISDICQYFKFTSKLTELMNDLELEK